MIRHLVEEITRTPVSPWDTSVTSDLTEPSKGSTFGNPSRPSLLDASASPIQLFTFLKHVYSPAVPPFAHALDTS